MSLASPDDRLRVYRHREDERDRFGGGSVMVRVGCAHGVKSQLIVVQGKMTAVRFFLLVVLLFYVHGKHLRPCRDGQLT